MKLNFREIKFKKTNKNNRNLMKNNDCKENKNNRNTYINHEKLYFNAQLNHENNHFYITGVNCTQHQPLQWE